ncbi:DUF1963 domain-containing protein [Actinoplanes sp. NPDC049265]|uniref:DUF1963 domain-containing protein n=1 Tax=Actinoplanes sp. NPDC049265 TaxID=3363902 RepID=UPI0037228813
MLSRKIEEFRTAAAERDIPGHEVDNLLAVVRFYAHLAVETAVGEPVAGRKGGLPPLPEDVPWPVGPSGRPLPFEALIDCAALPQDEELDLRLPNDGQLLFFLDYWTTSVHPYGGYENLQKAGRAFYFPSTTALVERPVPTIDGEPAHTPYPRSELVARTGIYYPQFLEVEDEDDEEYTDFVDENPNVDDLRELAGKFWTTGGIASRDVMIGGFALTPQIPPTDTIARTEYDTDGADLDELEERAEREWLPLAQFGLEDRTLTDTVARFLARRTDLEAGDFTRVVSLPEFMS